MYKTVFPVAFGLGVLYMWYFLKKGSSVKSIKTGTRNTKQEDQEKADSSVKKSAQEPTIYRINLTQPMAIDTVPQLLNQTGRLLTVMKTLLCYMIELTAEI